VHVPVMLLNLVIVLVIMLAWLEQSVERLERLVERLERLERLVERLFRRRRRPRLVNWLLERLSGVVLRVRVRRAWRATLRRCSAACGQGAHTRPLFSST